MVNIWTIIGSGCVQFLFLLKTNKHIFQIKQWAKGKLHLMKDVHRGVMNLWLYNTQSDLFSKGKQHGFFITIEPHFIFFS